MHSQHQLRLVFVFVRDFNFFGHLLLVAAIPLNFYLWGSP